MRAKVKITGVHYVEGGFHLTAVPVTDPSQKDAENSSFFKYTPSGEIKLTVTNPKMKNVFHPGEEYYVDFTPCK